MKEKRNKAIKEAWSKELREEQVRILKEVWCDPKLREKQFNWMRKFWDNPVARTNHSNAVREAWSKPEVRIKYVVSAIEAWNDSYRKENQRQFMLNGGALIAAAKIKNPSYPQLFIFRMTFLLFPCPILNYQFCRENGRSYFLDIADARLGINIEYDGSRYHQDKEKDRERDEELIEAGWKVLRYKDKVPTLEQLKQDILELM